MMCYDILCLSYLIMCLISGELYGHLYQEIDHKAVAAGAMAVVDSKIKLVLKGTGTGGGLPVYTQQLAETEEADRRWTRAS